MNSRGAVGVRVHIDPEPAPTPAQVASWRWLWRRLLASEPENSNAPSGELEASQCHLAEQLDQRSVNEHPHPTISRSCRQP